MGRALKLYYDESGRSQVGTNREHTGVPDGSQSHSLQMSILDAIKGEKYTHNCSKVSMSVGIINQSMGKTDRKGQWVDNDGYYGSKSHRTRSGAIGLTNRD